MAKESISQMALSSSLVVMQDTYVSPAYLRPSFQYDKINTATEELRVLILHPKTTGSDDEPIVCSLVRKEFGEKPVYEALSYMWGDQNITYSGDVKVNGCSITVAENLGRALARLRSDEDRTIWVDAICINQKDDQEKSLQIQLMPHIYERARKCLIWLGEASMDLDPSLLENHPWDRPYETKTMKKNSKKKRKPSSDLAELNSTLLEHLVNNPYWQRVWIIQEIGLARKLDMLYGRYTTTFSTFTSQLGCRDAFQESIPLRLQKQIDTKYQDSHNLQYLIESHQASQCQEPRDHIYGFVGLSADGMEFPIDYSKTHYQVWKDAVIFKSTKSTAPQSDLLSFAALVKKKLGDSTISNHEVIQDSIAYSAAILAARSQLEDERILSANELLELPGQIIIAARVAGRVAHIGPACASIIAFPRTTRDWRSSIYEYVETDRRPQVREESDLFLEKLEAMEARDFKLIENYKSTLIWKADVSTVSSSKKEKMEDPSPDLFEESKTSIDLLTNDIQGSDGQCLFLMAEVGQEEQQNLGWGQNQQNLGWGQNLSPQTHPFTQGSMGILPTGAREGDYLYRVNGISRAIVVRRDNVHYRIIGTAVIAGNLERARDIRDTIDLPFHQAEFDTISADERLDLYIDVAKAYRLLD